MSSWATRPHLQRVQKGREVAFSGHDAMEPYHDKWFISEDHHTPAHESSTFSRLGPIPKFVQSNAERPFVIERGELRGSGTLVNSAAKVFHDVTRVPPWHSALLDSAALHRLANFKPLELRAIQIQWLAVSCATMCCTESFRFSPCFKDGTVFPHRVGSIKRRRYCEAECLRGRVRKRIRRGRLR